MVYESVSEQEAMVATAIEDGRPHAASAFIRGFEHLNRLRRIEPRAGEERRRLDIVLQHARPGLTHDSLVLLDLAAAADSMAGELRAAGNRSASLGNWSETQRLDELATEIEQLERRPDIRDVLRMRAGIEAIRKRQTNVEIARWLAMALSPGDTIISNSGERIW